MKMPNGYDGVVKLKGKRRKPWQSAPHILKNNRTERL